MKELLCGISKQKIGNKDPVVLLFLEERDSVLYPYSFPIYAVYDDTTNSVVFDKKDTQVQMVLNHLKSSYGLKQDNLTLIGKIALEKDGFSIMGHKIYATVFHLDIYQQFINFSQKTAKSNFDYQNALENIKEWNKIFFKEPSEQTIYALRELCSGDSIESFVSCGIIYENLKKVIVKNKKTLPETVEYKNTFEKMHDNLLLMAGLFILGKRLTNINYVVEAKDLEKLEILWQSVALKTNIERTLNKKEIFFPKEIISEVSSNLERTILKIENPEAEQKKTAKIVL